MAFRPAGLALSSGFACSIGCPGGASGRRIESMTDVFRRRRFDRKDFIADGKSFSDAKPQHRKCQSVFSVDDSRKARGYASFGWRARMRFSIAFDVSTRCLCWKSLTQLVTVVTMSVGRFRLLFRAPRALAFFCTRSSRLITLTTFFSDIFQVSTSPPWGRTSLSVIRINDNY